MAACTKSTYKRTARELRMLRKQNSQTGTVYMHVGVRGNVYEVTVNIHVQERAPVHGMVT